jgi:hypothetical protein
MSNPIGNPPGNRIIPAPCWYIVMFSLETIPTAFAIYILRSNIAWTDILKSAVPDILRVFLNIGSIKIFMFAPSHLDAGNLRQLVKDAIDRALAGHEDCNPILEDIAVVGLEEGYNLLSRDYLVYPVEDRVEEAVEENKIIARTIQVLQSIME